MKIIEKKLFFRIAILSLLLVFVTIYLISDTTVKNRSIDPLVIALLIFNIIIMISNIVRETKKHSFSFSLMFWMFNFVFFGISPIIQYYSAWRAWGLYLDNDAYIKCSALILLWMLCYRLGNRLVKATKEANGRLTERISVNSHLAIIVQVLVVLYLLLMYGARLFFRGAESEFIIVNSSLSLLNHHIMRNAVYYLTIIQLLKYKTNKNGKFVLLLSFLLFFIGCFPLGISRYMVGAYYLGIIIYIIGKDRWKGWFSLIFLFAILIVFPLSNMFRFTSGFLSLEMIISNVNRLLRGTYNTGNYDAFQMFSAGIQYVELEGFSWGRRLIGAILFFIPRSIWKNKPVGTGGDVIIRLQNASFSNVSMPLIGESYINFGTIGIILFGILTGFLCEKYDRKFWTSRDHYGYISFIYPSALLYFFFLNRGDMLSAGSYMIANIVMGFLIRKAFVKDTM